MENKENVIHFEFSDFNSIEVEADKNSKDNHLLEDKVLLNYDEMKKNSTLDEKINETLVWFFKYRSEIC